MTHQDDHKLTNEMVANGMEAAPELMHGVLNHASQPGPSASNRSLDLSRLFHIWPLVSQQR